MIMAQDGTAHNGKVCIGSQEIVWELLNEVKQLPEGRLIYLHGNMPAIKHDAVFIVIYIRRILEPPLAVINRNRYDPVVIPGRMIGAARIPHILHTELALGITALLGKLGSRNGLGVFLGLGQVYGNAQGAVPCIGGPLHILDNPVAAYIIRILAQLIIPVRGFFRGNLIKLPKIPLHLTWSWHQAVHQLCIK